MEKITLPIHSHITGTCKLRCGKYRRRWLHKWTVQDGSTQSFFPLHVASVAHDNSTKIPWKEKWHWEETQDIYEETSKTSQFNKDISFPLLSKKLQVIQSTLRVSDEKVNTMSTVHQLQTAAKTVSGENTHVIFFLFF